jgi:adenylate cyclase
MTRGPGARPGRWHRRMCGTLYIWVYLARFSSFVDIDEQSLETMGQWPRPRNKLAELVDRLHAAGAAAIAFDFIFAEPDRLSPNRLIADPQLREALGVAQGSEVPVLPDNDLLFADAMQRGIVVIGFGGSANPGPAPPVKAGFAYTGADPAAYTIHLNGTTPVLPVLAEAADGIGLVAQQQAFLWRGAPDAADLDRRQEALPEPGG